MAKQKNPIETQLPEGAETFQQTDSTQATQPSEPKPEAVSSAEKRPEKPGEPEPDSFVLGILQSFPTHEALYVDRHGGAFTPDTPVGIRGDAVLYTNPFYKSKKTVNYGDR